jgi:hypothetical protein
MRGLSPVPRLGGAVMDRRFRVARGGAAVRR